MSDAGCSLEEQIRQSVRELGALLSKVSTTGGQAAAQAAQRSVIQQQSDVILQPLMDFLDGRSLTCDIMTTS